MIRPFGTHWALRGGRLLLCLFFLLAATYFAVTTLCAIANFGWRQPMFDQWRDYETLLRLPFPKNVLQEINGHRPVIPNLIRVAEIQWFGANQTLQLVAGTVAEILIVAIVAIAAVRERRLSPVARCAAVMLAVLGTLWLANARRLLHGTEALHGYLPTLACAVAFYLVFLSRARNSIACLWLACASCIVATFSFGLGLGSFLSVLLLCVLLRLPHRWIVLPLSTFALSLILYVFLLPGDQAVRGSVHLDLSQTVWQTGRWLASPWMNGWLNSGDSLSPPVADATTGFGRFVNHSAKVLVEAFGSVGVGLEPLSALLGLAGIAAFCAIVVLTCRKRIPLTALNCLAIGLGSFAIVSAVITVAARLEFLQLHPDQIFADRYLAWPSLFWSSLVILLVAQADNTAGRALRISGLAFLIALPIMLYATQWTSAIWSSIVYRISQQTASELLGGIYDHAHFPGLDVPANDQLRQIALLRDNHLAMFADANWQRIGTQWTGSIEASSAIDVTARWLDPVSDFVSGQKAGHVEGWFSRGVAKVRKFGQIAILDRDGVIAGFAEYSFTVPGESPLLLRPRKKRGFDAYVPNVRLAEKYTVAVLDFNSNRAIALMTLEPASDALAPAKPKSAVSASGAPRL